jgi:hypothetical protein
VTVYGEFDLSLCVVVPTALHASSNPFPTGRLSGTVDVVEPTGP